MQEHNKMQCRSVACAQYITTYNTGASRYARTLQNAKPERRALTTHNNTQYQGVTSYKSIGNIMPERDVLQAHSKHAGALRVGRHVSKEARIPMSH